MDILIVISLAICPCGTSISLAKTSDVTYIDSNSDNAGYLYRTPNLGIYLTEGAASFVAGNLAGFGAAVLLSLDYETPSGTHQLPQSILIWPVVYPFASAFGIHLTARIFKCPGSYWGAVGGGFVGVAVGLGSLYVLSGENTSNYVWALAAVLPPVFSTVGYNLFRQKDNTQSNFFLNRRYSTMVAYSVEITDGRRFPKMSVKLIEISF
jgi:hypothetical protein